VRSGGSLDPAVRQGDYAVHGVQQTLVVADSNQGPTLFADLCHQIGDQSIGCFSVQAGGRFIGQQDACVI
jgi:hypothetical protein